MSRPSPHREHPETAPDQSMLWCLSARIEIVPQRNHLRSVIKSTKAVTGKPHWWMTFTGENHCSHFDDLYTCTKHWWLCTYAILLKDSEPPRLHTSTFHNPLPRQSPEFWDRKNTMLFMGSLQHRWLKGSPRCKYKILGILGVSNLIDKKHRNPRNPRCVQQDRPSFKDHFFPSLATNHQPQPINATDMAVCLWLGCSPLMMALGIDPGDPWIMGTPNCNHPKLVSLSNNQPFRTVNSNWSCQVLGFRSVSAIRYSELSTGAAQQPSHVAVRRKAAPVSRFVLGLQA